jgi:6,7-dimethyl-8-ribityllumazine synthase
MQNADQGSPALSNGHELRIGIVQARFNEALTQKLCDSCVEELLSLGVSSEDISHVSVPGALEISIAMQALMEAHRFDAMIALGCVIRGETYHFELVANESAAGITRLSLDKRMPIANAILTTEDEEQAWARAEDKGRDAARVAVEMANLLAELS